MKEKKNENMNENVKIVSKKQENMRLNSVSSNLYFFSINNSLQKHGKKNHVEVIEYGGEIWINENYLQKKI